MTMTDEEVAQSKADKKSCFGIVTIYQNILMYKVERVVGCPTLDDIGRFLEELEKTEDRNFYERFTVEFPMLRARAFEYCFDLEWGFRQKTGGMSLEFVFEGCQHFDSVGKEYRKDFFNFLVSEVSDYYQNDRDLMSVTVDFSMEGKTLGAVVVTPYDNLEEAKHVTHSYQFVKNSLWEID